MKEPKILNWLFGIVGFLIFLTIVFAIAAGAAYAIGGATPWFWTFVGIFFASLVVMLITVIAHYMIHDQYKGSVESNTKLSLTERFNACKQAFKVKERQTTRFGQYAQQQQQQQHCHQAPVAGKCCGQVVSTTEKERLALKVDELKYQQQHGATRPGYHGQLAVIPPIEIIHPSTLTQSDSARALTVLAPTKYERELQSGAITGYELGLGATHRVQDIQNGQAGDGNYLALVAR